jgi:hypothetical protein
MPTLSVYYFDDTEFRGACEYIHASALAMERLPRTDLSGKRSALVLIRSENEIPVDPSEQANSEGVRAIIVSLLGDSASLTSEVRVGWRPYKYIEYFDSAPNRYAPVQLLLRVFFDINVKVPVGILGVDASISYYIFVDLDPTNRLRANIDGWAFSTSQGSAARENVRSELRQRVPGGVPTLQSLIDKVIAEYKDREIISVYLLPGSGKETGTGVVNPDEHASIAVVPRLTIGELAGRFLQGTPNG